LPGTLGAGLFLLGSYRDGLSVEKCGNKGVALARRLAGRVVARLPVEAR
jgi:hypothetical protein